jgi:polyhydroxyalkanoate synthesis regulator phasin
MSDSGRNNNLLTGLILGALVGAGLVYFLTSTEEGKKIKKQLQEKGKITLDKLADLIEEVEEKGEEFKQKAKKIQAQLEEKARDIQGRVAEEAKEQLVHIDELRERGQEASKRFFVKNGKTLA